MTAPLQVILNPVSGGGAGRRLRAELERELSARALEYTVIETSHRRHAQELARTAALQGAPAVVAAGGDGTVHEVANGLLDGRARGESATPALAVIPLGTGNDFAKLIPGVLQRGAPYDMIAAGHTRVFDVGRAEWPGGSEFFINGMGTGVDVEVVRQVERMPHLPGMVRYLVGLLRAVLGFRAIPLRIRLDEEWIEQRLMMIALGNGPCIGGGFYVCPAAVPDDGLLDVCLVRELRYGEIARVVPRVMRGTHGDLPQVTMRRARSIELHARDQQPLFFQLDGELREPPGARWLRVQVEPGALRVVSPAGAGGRS
ncbi:MAG: diacylglycerol kinase family lipid kinase [Gemmatimonadetes bacterium]|nr:diacylglycerol kinase family lipid kinase [Gemmatimonadota bacterium]